MTRPELSRLIEGVRLWALLASGGGMVISSQLVWRLRASLPGARLAKFPTAADLTQNLRWVWSSAHQGTRDPLLTVFVWVCRVFSAALILSLVAMAMKLA